MVVQIPCLNEEATLPLVIKTIPKSIPGIDDIDILVIDDGSSDKTVEVAKKAGVKHFVFHTKNRGLGRSFHDGVMKALEMGADIVVNTDGDNQYPQADIPRLVAPILQKKADIVVADRQINGIKHFSRFKKLMQKFGTMVLNSAAGTDIPDAASGFRAYSKEALLKINTVTRFSYCMETIIQAGNKRLAIASVPVKTNPKTRESRLFKSPGEHIVKSAVTIVRAYTMYKPYVLFIVLGFVTLVVGLIPFSRYFWFYLQGERGSHIQSLIVGSILLIGSLLSFTLGVLADLIRINRILIEDDLELHKRVHLALINKDSNSKSQ